MMDVELVNDGPVTLLARDVSGPRVILASASPRRRELLDTDRYRLTRSRPPTSTRRISPARSRGARRASRAREAPRSRRAPRRRRHRQRHDRRRRRRRARQAARRGRRRRHAAPSLGRAHIVFTAVAVAWRGRSCSAVEEVSVTFRALERRRRSQRYIATREPMDKAGAYGIQGFGATIVERMDGDYFAVMGLAIGPARALLRAARRRATTSARSPSA